MKIDPMFKPELCASKDETRPHLTAAYYQPEHKRVCATDGHRLLVIPVHPELGDRDSYVPSEVFKRARKLDKKQASATIEQVGDRLATSDGSQTPNPYKDEQFPPVDRVIPTPDGTEITIGLNAKYLWEIAQAMGAKAGDCNVRLVIRPGATLDPVRVEYGGSGAFAVLMPCRV